MGEAGKGKSFGRVCDGPGVQVRLVTEETEPGFGNVVS